MMLYSNAVTTTQAAEFGALMGFLAGFAILLAVIGIVYYVLLVIAW